MPGPLTRPSLVDPSDPRVAVARFTIDVGDTASSPTGQLFPVRDVIEATLVSL